MEVLEGNKLIAEFMGILLDPLSNTKTSVHFGSKTLQYHTSWDWLMPAWVKFWDVANKMCFDKAVQEPYDQLRNIRVIFMACIDEGDISNAQRILSDGITWYNSLNGGQNKKL